MEGAANEQPEFAVEVNGFSFAYGSGKSSDRDGVWIRFSIKFSFGLVQEEPKH